MINFSGCTAEEVTVMRVVCSPFLRLLVYLYDWENRFLQLPLNGGQSVLWLVLHCFSSILVDVRLRKSISPVAVEWGSVSFAAVCSLFCSMLVDVRLRKSIFQVAARVEVSFLCGCLFSLLQHACWSTTEETDFSDCRSSGDCFPRSKVLK